MPSLQKQRRKLQKIDKKIIKLLGKRFRLTRDIGRLKFLKGFAIESKSHEKQQNKQYGVFAVKYGVGKQLIQDIFDRVRTASKQEQESLRD